MDNHLPALRRAHAVAAVRYWETLKLGDQVVIETALEEMRRLNRLIQQELEEAGLAAKQ